MEMELPASRGVVSVFIALDWSDQASLRMWAKTMMLSEFLVLLTDEVTDGNAVLGRQLRCSGVVSASVRLPGLMRSELALEKARRLRDQTMARISDTIFDFGNVQGGLDRFAGKRTIRVGAP
jgi:hypothetical protein